MTTFLHAFGMHVPERVVTNDEVGARGARGSGWRACRESASGVGRPRGQVSLIWLWGGARFVGGKPESTGGRSVSLSPRAEAPRLVFRDLPPRSPRAWDSRTRRPSM